MLPGYGFSDLALIIGAAERVYIKFKDAPGQFQDLSREVRTFKSRVEELARRFPSNEQNSNGVNQIRELRWESEEVLEKLDTQLEKFKSLTTDKKSVSDRLRFDGDTKNLRERLRNLGLSIQGFQVDTILQQTDSIKTQVAQILDRLVKDKFDNKPIGSSLRNDLFNEICAEVEEGEISMDDIKEKEDGIIDAIAKDVEKQKSTLPNNASTMRPNAPARQVYLESDQLSKATVQEQELDFEDTSASSRGLWDTGKLPDVESTSNKAADEEAEAPKAVIPRGATKRISLCTVGNSSIAHDGQPPDPPPASVRDKTALFDQGVFRLPRYSSDEESGLRKTSTSSVGEATPQTIKETATQSSAASKGTSSSSGSQKCSQSSVAGFLSKIGESSWGMNEKTEGAVEDASTSPLGF